MCRLPGRANFFQGLAIGQALDQVITLGVLALDNIKHCHQQSPLLFKLGHFVCPGQGEYLWVPLVQAWDDEHEPRLEFHFVIRTPFDSLKDPRQERLCRVITVQVTQKIDSSGLDHILCGPTVACDLCSPHHQERAVLGQESLKLCRGQHRRHRVAEVCRLSCQAILHSQLGYT